MASIQQRGGAYQLRVKHRLLPKPFFYTFASEQEARNYGEQLERLLASGIVPQELMTPEKTADDLLLTKVLNQYTSLCPGLTAFDKEIAGIMLGDKPIVGLRLSALTYRWAESYVSYLKSAEKNLTPGSIR